MIFVNRDRKSLGQFTEQEISNALSSGEVLLTDLAWREGMESWQPVSTFTDLPPPGAAPAPQPLPPELANIPAPNRQLPGRIRFDECLSKGWEAFVKNWGACVMATLVFLGISIVVQVPMQLAQVLLERFTGAKGADPMMMAAAGGVFLFFWALASSVSAILTAGFMYFFISTLRTKADLNLVFAGFRSSNWLQILLAGGLWILAIFCLALVFMIPGGVLTATMKSEVPIVVFAVLFLVPVIYLSVGIGFVFPLIVDRRLGFREALGTAFRAVHSQWFSALGLLLLVGLVAMSGVILCCVGLLATLPLSYLIWSQGYRQIFGDPDSSGED
ncbi:MAG: GYF domain-containing protein [Verrucomicrobiae bacterium]